MNEPHQPPESLKELIAQLGDHLGTAFEQMEWAEQEITAAQQRHPTQADLLFHAFSLLATRHASMATEFIYRGYCRELLERVAADHDTRPGANVDVLLVCAEMSEQVPLNTTATGLYFRTWHRAFPDTGPVDAEQVAHYEALRGRQIDDLEAEVRRKRTVLDRRLPTDIACAGLHHGHPVTCRFATNPQAGRQAA
jgi:hypothetical protein